MSLFRPRDSSQRLRSVQYSMISRQVGLLTEFIVCEIFVCFDLLLLSTVVFVIVKIESADLSDFILVYHIMYRVLEKVLECFKLQNNLFEMSNAF